MEAAPEAGKVKQEVIQEELEQWLSFLDELDNKVAHNDLVTEVELAVPHMDLLDRLSGMYLEEVESYLRSKMDQDFTAAFARTLREVAHTRIVILHGLLEQKDTE